MRTWTPDVEINEETAGRLLLARFPELSPLRLNLLGSGWDNQAYLVNETLVFRIPHRKLGAQLMVGECAALTHFAHFPLPLPIPVPSYVSGPADDFPYPIAGYPILKGVTADAVLWSDQERASNAAILGTFLSELHRIPTDLPEAKFDELRRADLSYRLPIVLGKLKTCPVGFRELLQGLANSSPLSNSPVWVHGDLYNRHLIVDDFKVVTGVIDWGDTHVGDPALDLAIAWMFLPVSSHRAFREAYGPIDPDTWRRARFRAMTHWVYLKEYAEDKSDEALLTELEFLVQNVMSGGMG